MTGTARREEGAPVAATFADPRLIVLGENKMVGHAIHGMIALGGRSRRGSRVTPTPDSTLADAQQTIADLRRELAESEAQKAAMAEGAGRHKFLARRAIASVRCYPGEGTHAMRRVSWRSGR